jgi:hypothetical protein
MLYRPELILCLHMEAIASELPGFFGTSDYWKIAPCEGDRLALFVHLRCMLRLNSIGVRWPKLEWGRTSL